MKTKQLVLCSVSAALLCVLSPVTLPVGAVPITLATLVLYTVAGVLELKYSLLTVLVYIAIGCIGLPVFSGFGAGVGHILGPTGGFILGYLPLVIVVGAVYKSKNRFLKPAGLCLATLLLYLMGVIQYAIVTNTGDISLLFALVIPFLPGDILKIVIALLVIPKIRRKIKNI